MLAEVRKATSTLPLPHRRRGRGVMGQRESGHWGKGADGLGLLAEKAPQYQMKGVYQQADFFLLPTEYEIFGMVLLEAMFFRRWC
ncbi:MAG: hypothetical protein ACLUIR_02040 [Faecalibacterium prausnitzii]